MNKAWVIPYIDQPPDFWHGLQDEYGEWIEEVYFPMPLGLIASGRSRQPEEHLEDFLRQTRLPKALLINPIVLPETLESMKAGLLNRLEEMFQRYGIRAVTVTNLQLACLIRKELPYFSITGSCLMGISSPAQVLMLESNLDSLTPDTRLSHDLNGLRRVKDAFHGKLRLLVNESCLPGCPMRTQHFYEMAYSASFPQSLCHALLQREPWLRMTGGWILPQHLHYYDAVCDCFKLAGRVTLRDPLNYRRVLNAYMQRCPMQPAQIGGGPASILTPLEIPERVFKTLLTCSKNCHQCSFCRDFFAAGAAVSG